MREFNHRGHGGKEYGKIEDIRITSDFKAFLCVNSVLSVVDTVYLVTPKLPDMNLVLNDSISFPAMMKVLTEKFPNYQVVLKKNPVAGFEYIQVRKSTYVGLWIRIFPKKNRVMLIKTIPSTMARALFGGLIVILIASSAQGKLRDEIAEVLKTAFNTTVQP